MNAIPRFRFWKVFGALRRCDALLSGGGSLLQDRTSTRSLLYYLSIVRCAEWMGKPVMLYANGIGPVQKPANRRRVKRAVERAALVTPAGPQLRPGTGGDGVERPDLHVTADPVFNLDPAPKERAGELLRSAGLERGTPFAAVSVRDWPDTGSFAGGAGRPVRPSLPDLRDGDPVPDDAAPAGTGRPPPRCGALWSAPPICWTPPAPRGS